MAQDALTKSSMENLKKNEKELNMLNCFMDYVLTCKDVTNVKADMSMNTTSPSTCWLLHLKLEDKKKPQHTAYIYVCVRAEVHSKIHSQLIYKNKVVSCFT